MWHGDKWVMLHDMVLPIPPCTICISCRGREFLFAVVRNRLPNTATPLSVWLNFERTPRFCPLGTKCRDTTTTTLLPVASQRMACTLHTMVLPVFPPYYRLHQLLALVRAQEFLCSVAWNRRKRNNKQFACRNARNLSCGMIWICLVPSISHEAFPSCPCTTRDFAATQQTVCRLRRQRNSSSIYGLVRMEIFQHHAFCSVPDNSTPPNAG